MSGFGIELSSPMVSVIMNCLNCTQYLREAVDSVYAQTYPNWEIILWDNASDEDVHSALSGYDDRLRYFRGEKTVSLGEARNLAIAEAKGDLIAFLDCDDVWLSEKLEKGIPCFSDPQVGLVYSDWTLFNNKGYYRNRYNGSSAPQGWVFEHALLNNFTCLSTLIIRGSLVYLDGIKFDPQFTYIEDTDFLIRIARKWKIAYIPQALTKYRMHNASASCTKVQGFREEADIMIDKYITLFPEFADKYARRLRSVNAKDRAINYWQSGDRRIARHLLHGHLFGNWRYSMIYLSMFLPFPFVDWIRQRISRRATGYYQ